MIISQHTGQPVKITFAMVGKGKSVHYSTGNDDTLCGKGVSRYVDGSSDAPLCKPCARIERVKNAETDMIVSDAAMETASVIMDSDPSTWAPEFDRMEASECFFGCDVTPVA